MENDKRIVVSKMIEVFKNVISFESNKLALLMPFGLITGHADNSEHTGDSDFKSLDAILLRDVEVLPFVGNRFKMHLLTVLPDQILGLSVGNLEK